VPSTSSAIAIADSSTTSCCRPGCVFPDQGVWYLGSLASVWHLRHPKTHQRRRWAAVASTRASAVTAGFSPQDNKDANQNGPMVLDMTWPA
jgi:hypothetical protein